MLCIEGFDNNKSLYQCMGDGGAPVTLNSMLLTVKITSLQPAFYTVRSRASK